MQPSHLTPKLMRLFIGLLLLLSCSSNGKKKSVHDNARATFEQQLAKKSAAEVDTTYAVLCRNLDRSRLQLKKEWNKSSDKTAREAVLAKARKLLYTTLSDSLFVCWYGTKWDFNGTTSCPRQGNIACGYFVTTVLQQAGFPLDRVYLAQQASSTMIKALCPAEKIKTVSNHQQKKLTDHLRSRPDGIFILGLDKHTGFVVKEGDSLDFVHSSFWPQGHVVRVPLEKSEIVKESNYYVAGELLFSDETIRKWINGEKI